MANNTNLVALTQQDFGNLYKLFPAAGLGGDYPDGGTIIQYYYLARLDIASYDMTRAVRFMENHIAAEIARVSATGTQVTPAMRKNHRTACEAALLAAWNASNHLAPGGGLISWTSRTSARWCKEKLCNSCWPKDRRKMIKKIIDKGPSNAAPAPTPTAMHQLPAWYNAQLANLGVAAPVQN